MPPSATDQILWLKADAGVTKDGSDRVSQWVDQSSVGSLATQATGSRQPLWVEDAINGQPALRFDGTDTFSVNAYGPGGTGITIFVVASGQEYQNVVCYWQSGEYVMYPWKSIHDGDYVFVQASDGGTNGVATGFLKDQWNLGVAKWHAGQVNGMAAWRNGLLVDQRDAYNTTMPTVPLWIGSRQMEEGFQGDVAEILVYDSGLSDADRISVQEYLAQKYGLPGAFDPSSIAGLQLWLKGDSGIGDSSFYSFDERGNTRALVSPTGSVSDFYLYDAYGQQLTASGSTANTFRYGGAYGYVFDGLDRMDVRMRGYDPGAGRWLSRDRWGFYGGINLYLYSYNDPINLIDPIGAGSIAISFDKGDPGSETNPYPAMGTPPGKPGFYQSPAGELYKTTPPPPARPRTEPNIFERMMSSYKANTPYEGVGYGIPVKGPVSIGFQYTLVAPPCYWASLDIPGITATVDSNRETTFGWSFFNAGKVHADIVVPSTPERITSPSDARIFAPTFPLGSYIIVNPSKIPMPSAPAPKNPDFWDRFTNMTQDIRNAMGAP